MSQKHSPQPLKGAGQYLPGVALARSRVVVVTAVLASFAFGARAAVNAFGEIRYWSPETPLEYTAVALLSVAMLFLGATLWALGSFWATDDHPPGRAAKLSWLSVRVAALAAVLVAVSNFLEDYLRLRWFGMTFVIGGIALLLGLLCATGLRLAAPRVDKVEGILLGAAALLLLAAYHAWFRDRRRPAPRAARVT
jgi:uncharacterized membrane protein YwzB